MTIAELKSQNAERFGRCQRKDCPHVTPHDHADDRDHLIRALLSRLEALEKVATIARRASKEFTIDGLDVALSQLDHPDVSMRKKG